MAEEFARAADDPQQCNVYPPDALGQGCECEFADGHEPPCECVCGAQWTADEVVRDGDSVTGRRRD